MCARGQKDTRGNRGGNGSPVIHGETEVALRRFGLCGIILVVPKLRDRQWFTGSVHAERVITLSFNI